MHKCWLMAPLAMAAAGLGGCAGDGDADREVALRGTPAMAPMPLGPAGASGEAQADPPHPPIDLSEENVAAWSVAEASVIDTGDFEVQIADVSGEGSRPVKEILPPHERPAVFREGPPNDLEATPSGDFETATPLIAFDGIGDTGWNPPDPTLAVGPNHIVSTVNMSIAFYGKDGELEFQQLLGSPGDPGFFEPLGAGDFTFDPKCVYHPGIDRFIVLALEVYQGSNESWITIAISDDDDPNGVWYKYRTWSVVGVGSGNYWVDYPGLGFDDDGVYVTGNLFHLSGGGGGFGGVLYRAFDLQPMMDGEPVEYVDIRSGDSGSVQSATSVGSPAAPYFVSLGSSTRLRLEALRNPLSDPELVSWEIPIPAWDRPADAPNGGGSRIATLDGRIMNASWRDGRLVTGHAIGVNGNGSRSVARWYEVDTAQWPHSGTPTLVQSGEVAADASHWTFFPALVANSLGEIAMVLAGSRSGEFATIAATTRAAGDPPGQMGEPVEIHVGTSEAEGRWGDYFDITVDPVDDRTFWGIGQVRNASGWTTHIVSFAASCPADLDGDGRATVDDFFAFLDFFADGDMAADLNGDGAVNIGDLFAFLDIFEQGC